MRTAKEDRLGAKGYSFYMGCLVVTVLIWPLYSYLFARFFQLDFWRALKLDSITYLPCLLFLFRGFVPGGLFPPGASPAQRIVYLAGFTYTTVIALKIVLFCLHLFKEGYIFQRYNHRQIGWTLFFLCLVSFLALNVWVNRTNLSGDEPHYMLITHSIVYDRDLNLTNNLLQKDYLSFYPAQMTSPLHGLPYSVHREGLSLVLAPAYFLGGLTGARAMMGLITATLVTLTYFVIYRVTVDVKISLLAALLMAFSVPIAIYSNQIYPDALGALVILVALSRMVASPLDTASASERGVGDVIIVALCISALPFLNVRYVPLALGLFLASLFWMRGHYSIKKCAALLVPLAIAAVGYLYSCYYMYGGLFSPVAFEAKGLRGYFQSFSLTNLSLSSLYLLFDQQGGLLFFSPIYCLAFLGVALGIRFYRRQSLLLLTIVGCYFLLYLVSCPSGGEGWSPPCRYLLTITPLLIIFVAFALKHCRGEFFQFVWWILGSIGFLIAFILTAIAHLRYPWTPGRNQILGLVGRLFHVDLSGLFPNCIIPTTISSISMLIWVLLLIGVSVYFYLKACEGKASPASETGGRE